MFNPFFLPSPIGFDPSLLSSIIVGTRAYSPRHRSPGGRAHRRWRKLRSAGRR